MFFFLSIVLLFLASCGASGLLPLDVIPERLNRGEFFCSPVGEDGGNLFDEEYFNKTPATFRQLVDHSKNGGSTFDQRYWVDYSAWNKSELAMLYIRIGSGDFTSPRGYPGIYGHERNMLLFTLEGRYYGKSLPFPLTETEKLKKYLNVDIALEDIRGFQKFVEEKLLQKKLRWLIVGGSYAGALAVWFKAKYPTAALAVWSSSAIVEAQFDFYGFDGRVKSAISPECVREIYAVQSLFSELWENETARVSFLNRFNIPHYFDKSGILYMMADAVAGAVQYGKKWKMCDLITQKNDMDIMGRFFYMINLIYGQSFTTSCIYSTECLSNSTMSNQWVGTGYAWFYQSCSELAFFQVGYYNGLRSLELNTEYFVNQCRSAFGDSVFPDVFRFNVKWGGKYPKASNVVATHGSSDPWIDSGVTTTNGPGYRVLIANCADCGRSGDLATPRPTDSEALQLQRDELALLLDTWMTSERVSYKFVLGGSFISQALLEKEKLMKAIQSDLHDFFDHSAEIHDFEFDRTSEKLTITFVFYANRMNKERISSFSRNIRKNSSFLLATKKTLSHFRVEDEALVIAFEQISTPIIDENPMNENEVIYLLRYMGFFLLFLISFAVIACKYRIQKNKNKQTILIP
ncbi:serine carboxypeptidase S28, putative [Trypanosoma cruzi]|uniref:Serine carboxypeptidase S28, putative n=2 Tax=Trypanosoma cruzi TaxID=5693 RepID=Q4DM56_TRYCC|nr:serine carboxypeptidase S28, putative [Trypanosoma cruzi]EAN93592.1 serine carboxypeptidase S28, putative [Trypanosoma cruzi]|eukprot:XP_815443.1 serine carboxypeptidase S28 [Trypanosoma cruzi strain CL Brener]